MSGPDARYRVYSGDAERDQAAVLRAWRECGADYSPAFADGAARYSWFYLRNPAGRAQVFFLEHVASGRVVGVLGLGAREFWRHGVRVPAGVLVDFVIHPEHRVFYPALLLQRFARDCEVNFGRLLIGHPNENSGAIIRRAGYRDLPFSRFARLVGFTNQLGRAVPRALAVVPGKVMEGLDRVAIALRRRLGERVDWHWGTRFDGRYDSLWQARVTDAASLGCRSARFLEWRFMDQPGRRYRLLEFSRPQAIGLLGYCVCEIANGTLNIVDALLPADRSLQRVVLLTLVAVARDESITGISFPVADGEALRRSLSAAGFVERDQGTLLISDHGDAEGQPANCTEANWYFTMADLDT